MHGIKFLLFMTFLFFLSSESNSQAEAEAGMDEVMIGADYRYDVIDYDNIERKFYRGRLSLAFSSMSSFNFAYVYLDEGEKRHTWNLKLFDISEHARFIIGNYQANFGAGLLLGKKIYISSDPFYSIAPVTAGGVFTGVNSGNPLYSFNGIASVFSFLFSGIDISLNGFYSLRQRYISGEEYEDRYVKSSLSTVNLKLHRSGIYNYPVTIYDSGCMIGFNHVDIFNFQFYYFQSGLKGAGDERFKWDYFDDPEEHGIDEYRAYGFFSKYSDEFVKIFFEYGMSDRDVRISGRGHKVYRDYGLLYGASFNHHYFNMSINGKDTGEKFYSLYSSGKNYPERMIDIDASINPADRLSLGGSVSSSKRISPGKYDCYLPAVIGESVFIKYGISRSESVEIRAGRAEYEKDDSWETLRQVKGSIKGRIFSFLEAELSGISQWSDDSGYSREISSSAGVQLLKFFNFQAKYSKVYISDDNYIYVKNSNGSDSISGSTMESRTTNKIMGRLLFKHNRSYFLFMYENCYIGSRSLRKRMEFSGKIYF